MSKKFKKEMQKIEPIKKPKFKKEKESAKNSKEKSFHQVDNIEKLIDMPIVSFMEFIIHKPFNYNNILKKQLEMAKGRMISIRSEFAIQLEDKKIKSGNMDLLMKSFISTFVMERVIEERINIVDSYCKKQSIQMKG